MLNPDKRAKQNIIFTELLSIEKVIVKVSV